VFAFAVRLCVGRSSASWCSDDDMRSAASSIIGAWPDASNEIVAKRIRG
jgi:hypothetical protein